MISYPPGTPSWTDVSTSDVDAGISFYSELFGWEAEPVGEDPEQTGNYHMFKQGGKQVAGIGKAMQGMPPVWNVYVAVEDADAALAKAEAEGGTIVIPGFDVFTAGRMGVFTDPGGAFLCVWQPGDNKGAEIVNAVGAFNMAEVDTRDPDGAQPFYSAVFGWEFAPVEDDGAVVYHQIKLDGRLVAGLFPIPPGFPDEIPNHWRPYFGVEDLDAAMAKVRELGGQVLQDPVPIPEGRFVSLLDPFGATFSIWEGSYDPPPGG
jgi:predicted enzyme related to lactoylglutathione lyase